MKHENFIHYLEAAIRLTNKFERFYINHVPRHENVYTDALVSLVATLAMPPGTSRSISIRGCNLLHPKVLFKEEEVYQVRLDLEPYD